MTDNAFKDAIEFKKELKRAKKYLYNSKSKTSKRAVMENLGLNGSKAQYVMNQLVLEGILKQSKTKAGQVRYVR